MRKRCNMRCEKHPTIYQSQVQQLPISLQGNGMNLMHLPREGMEVLAVAFEAEDGELSMRREGEAEGAHVVTYLLNLSRDEEVAENVAEAAAEIIEIFWNPKIRRQPLKT